MTDNLTLYVNPITVNSIKIQLLCRAMGIEPEYQQIELHLGQQKSKAFLQINPDGKVPVLLDGDFVLNESNAILQYLANKYQSALWPSDAAAQGEVLKWLFWQTNYWNKSVGVLAHRRVVLPHWGFNADQDMSPDEESQIHRALTSLDYALADKQVLVGGDVTLADISLSSYLIFADEAKIPLEPYRNVSRWLNGLHKMPWWQETQQSLRDVIKPVME